MIKSRGRGILSSCVGPIPLLGLTPDRMMGPLQLSDHVVLNRQTGEQLTNWDKLNKTTKFGQLRQLLSSLVILYHVFAQLQGALWEYNFTVVLGLTLT